VSQTQSVAVKNSTAPRIWATTSHDDDNRRCKRVGSTDTERKRERERERAEPAGDVCFHLFVSYGGVCSLRLGESHGNWILIFVCRQLRRYPLRRFEGVINSLHLPSINAFIKCRI
jgi:hypothetical protein